MDASAHGYGTGGLLFYGFFIKRMLVHMDMGLAGFYFNGFFNLMRPVDTCTCARTPANSVRAP